MTIVPFSDLPLNLLSFFADQLSNDVWFVLAMCCTRLSDAIFSNTFTLHRRQAQLGMTRCALNGFVDGFALAWRQAEEEQQQARERNTRENPGQIISFPDLFLNFCLQLNQVHGVSNWKVAQLGQNK